MGVIIGKGGDTIKYLQVQSGAKIQVTRDMDADPNSPTRSVEIQGTPEQIAKAEELIAEVLAQVNFFFFSRSSSLYLLTSMIKIDVLILCYSFHAHCKNRLNKITLWPVP